MGDCGTLLFQSTITFTFKTSKPNFKVEYTPYHCTFDSHLVLHRSNETLKHFILLHPRLPVSLCASDLAIDRFIYLWIEVFVITLR